jgi:hypothetical protein
MLVSLDGRGHDLDVLAFARACRGGQLPGVHSPGARFGDLHVHLMDASARDVSERERRIFIDGAVESLASPVPGRKNTIDTVAVKRRGAVRYRRKRQIVSVPVHLAVPPTEGEL